MHMTYTVVVTGDTGWFFTSHPISPIILPTLLPSHPPHQLQWVETSTTQNSSWNALNAVSGFVVMYVNSVKIIVQAAIISKHCVCMHAFTYTCVYACTYTCVDACMHTVHVCMHVHIRVRMHVCIRVCMHVRICVYACMYTCVST